MKYYIGLDAHFTTSTFAVVDSDGHCVLRETVNTSEQSLVHVINKIHGVRHLTFEESTISQWLYLQLKDKVDELLVCNPTNVAEKSGAKTDFRDALHLAQELRTNHLKPVYHDNSHWIELRVSVSGYLDLVEEIVRTKNRLKSVFRAAAIQTNENSFYKSCGRVKELICAIVCQPSRFANKHRFWGYCMLVRHIQQSGGRIYGNKRFHGRKELRDLFIGAAESAARTETSLRDFYDALRAKGATHKQAKLSLARRIASVALCLLKNNDKYNDNYDEYLKERKELRKKFFNQTQIAVMLLHIRGTKEALLG